MEQRSKQGQRFKFRTGIDSGDSDDCSIRHDELMNTLLLSL